MLRPDPVVAAVGLVLAVVALLTCAAPARATGGGYEFPRAVGDISAESSAVATASGGGAIASGSGGGGGSSSVSSRALGLGMPSFANGALTCEAQLPLVGGTYERENCGALLAAKAVHDLVPVSAGRDELIKESLCQNSYLRRAYALTGRKCKEPPQ